jgi:hypothetical protein
MDLIKLEIREKIDTPYVCLDPETGLCEITGKSYPEDVSSFYNQIEDWFDEYIFSGEKDMTLNMKLSYFNSSSQKVFTQIFEKLKGANFKVLVNWHYPTEDDEILENGKIYNTFTGFKFNFLPY